MDWRGWAKLAILSLITGGLVGGTTIVVLDAFDLGNYGIAALVLAFIAATGVAAIVGPRYESRDSGPRKGPEAKSPRE